MNKLLLNLMFFSLVPVYAAESDKTKETVRKLEELLDSGAPIVRRAVKPGENLLLSASQAAHEINMKSFPDDYWFSKKKPFNFERDKVVQLRQARLADDILRFSDLEKIESWKTDALNIDGFHYIDEMALLTVYALDSLADTIRLKEDKALFKDWLAYLEETSCQIKNNLKTIYDQMGTIEIKVAEPKGNDEKYAYQAAFEIQKKSFSEGLRLPINKLRQQRLAQDILIFSDIDKIKNKHSDYLSDGFEREAIFNYFDEIALRTVYALDGLIGKIKLEEDKERFKHWLAYLEKTSEKIKENLEIMYSQR